MLNYLAFGSNLTPARLFARVGICEVIGTARIPGYRMGFRKRGNDDSAKCDIYTGAPGDVAEGVVFALPDEKRPVLDRFEGVGNGYEVAELDATVNGAPMRVIAYQAQPPFIDDSLLPYDWYHAFVLEGGKRFGLSDAWTESVSAVDTRRDPDAERARRNAEILLLSDEAALAMSRQGLST